MDGVTLLSQARESGIEVHAAGEQLRVRGPRRYEALVKALFEHKEDVLAAVELYEERAATMEYDGGLPRAEAERQAWECVVTEAQSLGGRTR